MKLNLSAKLLVVIGFLLMALVPTIAQYNNDQFMVVLISRIVIYAIAASALNIALGFGGMVSLGHALFIGIGMYSVALPAHFGITNAVAQLAICMGACILVATITGLISLRTSGIAFIMITLAFAQMGYFVVVSLKQFGGDDGLAVAAASQLFGFSLSNANHVFYVSLTLLAALTIWIKQLKDSPFGMTLRASRQNSRRISSIGLALRQYQLTAYVMSAVLCGVAGMLLANLSAYASPSSMSWMVSGDLIVMVVLGGIGSVMGPIIGAFLFLGLEELLKAITENWMAVFGLMILMIAMLGKTGVIGWIEKFLDHKKSKSKSTSAQKENG